MDTPGRKKELYDLASDIGERTNLADEQKTKVARMKQMLDGWEGQMHPPLYQFSLKAEK